MNVGTTRSSVRPRDLVESALLDEDAADLDITADLAATADLDATAELDATGEVPSPASIAVNGSWARLRLRYQQTVFAGDIIIGLIAATLGATLRSRQATTHGTAGTVSLVVGLTVGWPGLLYLGRCYEARYIGAGTEEFRRIASAGVRVLAVIALASFVFRVSLARSFVGISVPIVVAGSLAWHGLLRHWLNRTRARGRGQHRVLVVGRWAAASRMCEALATTEGEGVGLRVVGVCCDSPDAVSIDGTVIPTVGMSTTGDIIAALQQCGADTVAVASDSGLTSQQLRQLGWRLEGSVVDLLVGTDLVEVAGPRIRIRPVAGLPLLHVEQPELRGTRRLVKASYDRVLSLLALIMLSPLLLAVGLAVRFTSHGPALYRQARVGRNGDTFSIVKFRSMYDDADARLSSLSALNEHDGPLFKMRNDPRVTPLGRRLRAWSLDELPQLWNVLLGHMSLVGPRPPLPSEVETYGDDVRRRLLVKPGVTGLWQVSGRSELTWEQCVRLDLSYVENWSPALDLSILVKTLRAVLARSGAY